MAVVNRRMVLKECGALLELETSQPVPTAPPGGAILRVHYAGICHTDVALADYGKALSDSFTLPRVLGHEIAGTVFSLGEGSEQAHPEVAVGSKAILFAVTGCGQCSYCKAGMIGFCESFTTCNAYEHLRLAAQKSNWYSADLDGGFQDYMVVDSCQNLVVPPDDLPLEICCLLGCGGLSTYHAVTKMRESIRNAIAIKGKARVALVGAGGMSMWAMSFLKNEFPPDKITICAVDIQESKLKAALEYGADCTVLWQRDASAVDSGKQLVDASGAMMDAVLDFVANTSSMKNILQCVSAHATVVIIGVSPTGKVDAPTHRLLCLNLTVSALTYGTRAQLREIADMVNAKKIKVPPFNVIPFEAGAVNEAIQAVRAGTQIGRAVIQFAGAQ